MAALLEIKGVSKSFGGIAAVRDVDTTVQAGEIRGLIGPNGAGKTTLINLITGFTRPDRGSVQLEGLELVGLQPYRVNRLGLARTFQNIRLFPQLTVLEAVMVGMHARQAPDLWSAITSGRRAAAAERRMREQAVKLLDLLGMGARQGVLAGALPYGQQRLVEIARALATLPRLLLLDEPAAGLIGGEVTELADRIRTIRQTGITVLLIEHNMEFVMPLCDRITVLDFGRKIAEGTPAEIQVHPAVIEAYLGRAEDAAS